MKKKINLYMFLAAVVAILSTFIVLTATFQKITAQRFESNLRSSCEMLEELWSDDSSKNYSFGNIRVSIINPDNIMEYDSDNENDEVADYEEVKQARQTGEGFDIRKNDSSENVYYFAKTMENGDIIRVAEKAGNMLVLFGNLLPSVICLLILMAAVCLIITKYLTADIINPIERMADNLNFAEKPEYDELVPVMNMLKEQHENVLNSAKVRQEFSANISHELKTPLTVISGYAELIENKMVTENDTVRFAGEIHHNADRLLTLINDVIRLSELDSESTEVVYERVDIADIVDECMQVISSTARQHNVSVELNCEHCMINGNKSMIEEIVMNLSNNAIIYNRPGGNVWVSVYNDDGRTVLEVKDNGIGIPKEHHTRIFERFYRVDKSRSKRSGGTGLGLAIVKHIASSHNAVITLNSVEGEGTDIKVIF